MDFLIYYAQIGLLANFIAFILSIFIAVYLTLNLDMVEIRKLAMISEQKRDVDYLNLLGFIIPFYELYLMIIKIILIRKYYDRTADSIEFIITETEMYSIFRRKNKTI